MIAKRLAAPPGDAAERAAEHACRVLDGARSVAVYAPMPGKGELDTLPLVKRLLAGGVTLAYPRVISRHDPLTFHMAGTAELRPGTWEIPEPTTDAPKVALDHLDAILVPTLVFDEQGNRIGWGAGHYDRTLRAAPQALRVGFAYAFQRAPEPIPTTPSDEPLDVVVTEEGVLRGPAERQRRSG